eukprot:7588596-Alexandrium_andersonii.AAC.1
MTLRAAPRSKGSRWLGSWPTSPVRSTPCWSARRPLPAGSWGSRRLSGPWLRAPTRRSPA